MDIHNSPKDPELRRNKLKSPRACVAGDGTTETVSCLFGNGSCHFEKQRDSACSASYWDEKNELGRKALLSGKDGHLIICACDGRFVTGPLRNGGTNC